MACIDLILQGRTGTAHRSHTKRDIEIKSEAGYKSSWTFQNEYPNYDLNPGFAPFIIVELFFFASQTHTHTFDNII